MVSFDDLTDEQQRAATALDRSVNLTAGAGTGKTTTLTERYVQLVDDSIPDPEAISETEAVSDPAAEIVTPENVLVTTFTERAAAELTESVRVAVTERLAEEPPETFPYWRAVVDGLADGYVNTLHGVCARLLREHAVSLDRLDPGFETLEQGDADALVEQVVGRVVADRDDEPLRRLADRFGSRRAVTSVVGDLVTERGSEAWAEAVLAGDRDTHLDFVRRLLHPIDPSEARTRLSQPAFEAAVTTLQEIVADPQGVDTGGRAWGRVTGLLATLSGTDAEVGGAEWPPTGADAQETLAAVATTLTTGGDRYADYTGAKTRWDDDAAKASFDEAIEAVVDCLEPERYAVDIDTAADERVYPTVRALATVTLDAHERYQERKRADNVADFSDLVGETLRLLDERPAVRDRLRDQFDYVMIDEFQDTDPRQWSIVERVTGTDRDGFDADNVFVVGDAKQSIYRFRDADVTQVDRIAELLDQHDPDEPDQTPETDDTPTTADDTLTTNFRTLPAVLETINALFDEVFDGDGPAYEAAPQRLTPAREDPADLAAVEYLAVPTDPDLRARRCPDLARAVGNDPDDEAVVEATALAGRIAALVDEACVYPEDGEESTPQTVEPSDIALLLRSRGNLQAFERAFDQLGVPYSVAAGVGFHETPEVTALTNCLRVLADPHDDRALYALLRSPLFGVTDDTLARLADEAGLPDGEEATLSDGEEATLWNGLQTTETAVLRDVRDTITEWRRLVGAGETAETNDRTSEPTAGLAGEWHRLLDRIVDDTGLLVSVSADERPTQARANVEKFRERLRTHADDGVWSPQALVTRLDDRRERSVRDGQAETTGEGVHVTTVHDAKGLEFPVVAVPGLSRRFHDEAAVGDGRVEFERVETGGSPGVTGGETDPDADTEGHSRRHAVGLKAPGADPFDSVDTVAREGLRSRRRREERAEEKRVLYVACTRARDRLLLSGRHDTADEPAVTDFEPADTDDPSRWRDWVQPALLDDDVLEALADADAVETTLGDGRYTVRLPTQVDRVASTATETVELDRSPTPVTPEAAQSFSATAVRKRVASTAARDDTPAAEDATASTDSVSSAATAADGPNPEISPTAFGTAVHRVCELRPPAEAVPQVVREAFVEHGETLVDEQTVASVRDHAQRGIAAVDEIAASVSVVSRHDELFVSRELGSDDEESVTGGVTVYGYVDHLVVAEDTLHVVDYKTGAVDGDLAAAAAEYDHQVATYAAALADGDRAVETHLVFTAVDEVWSERYEPAERRGLRAELRETLTDD